MNTLNMEGNIGCMYFLRWENMVDDNITTELLWYSNLDTPLEEMDEEESNAYFMKVLKNGLLALKRLENNL